MTRHKSRVARRSRRSARRGTRKQSGGFAWLKKLIGMKTDPPAPATQSAAELTTPTKSWLTGLFSSSNDDKANTHTPSPTQSLAPPATKPAETQSLAPVQEGGRKKSRKTRHRRHRSPRHHRK